MIQSVQLTPYLLQDTYSQRVISLSSVNQPSYFVLATQARALK